MVRNLTLDLKPSRVNLMRLILLSGDPL
jgi:hypothetical protein